MTQEPDHYDIDISDVLVIAGDVLRYFYGVWDQLPGYSGVSMEPAKVVAELSDDHFRLAFYIHDEIVKADVPAQLRGHDASQGDVQDGVRKQVGRVLSEALHAAFSTEQE